MTGELLWAACCFLIGCLFLALGRIQMRWAHKEGESIGFVLGERKGRAEGQIEGYVRGEKAGTEKGEQQGYARGKRDALPPRARNGWFVGRPK
jgi:hypothetical protein